MLKLCIAAAALAALAYPAAAQEQALGNPTWIPGQSRSTLTLYEQAGMQGGSVLIVEREGHLAGSFRAASLRTTGGPWEICDRPNFQGRCEVVDGWTLSLNRDLGLRAVRSVRPLEWDDLTQD